jgi:aspartate/methionine/tyrosine aminotransferase
MEGVRCNPTEGALYCFPQITLPPAAVTAAIAAGRTPDSQYCIELLDETGVVVVPGSGFGQAEGSWHFRATILPPEEKLDGVIDRVARFHDGFLARYAAPKA